VSGQAQGLEAHLRSRREQGRKLLVAYVTGGLGRSWPDVVRAAVAAGADAVEVGIPFSDPMIDGPTIQRASSAALAAGATPLGVISAVAELEVDVPVAVMTYYNLVLRGGLERMAFTLASRGVAATILPDLPLEESGPWRRAAGAAGLEHVMLAAPSSSDRRLEAICRHSRGFVYGVALMGVTGERDSLAATAKDMARRLKAATDRPVLIGVGVSTPEQAAELSRHADGVVVGSALVRRLLEGGGPEEVAELVSQLRSALDA
jgi:tryptophan synthase alpha chain